MQNPLGWFSLIGRVVSSAVDALRGFLDRRRKRSRRSRLLDLQLGPVRVHYESRHDDEFRPPAA